MNVQTRGDFEKRIGLSFLPHFVFINYKGKWRGAIVEMSWGRVVYSYIGSENVYLAECIVKVYVPMNPDEVKNFKYITRQDQKKKCCKILDEWLDLPQDRIDIKKLLMEAD